MLRIPCPFCGPRDEIEFRYRGDASVSRPIEADGFAGYVYERENPRGSHSEHWLHIHGCRQVLRVERDTLTHAIHKVEAVR